MLSKTFNLSSETGLRMGNITSSRPVVPTNCYHLHQSSTLRIMPAIIPFKSNGIGQWHYENKQHFKHNSQNHLNYILFVVSYFL